MDSRIIFSAQDHHCFAKKYGTGYPCLNCDRDCCTDYVIFITHVDILRIHREFPELRVSSYVDAVEADVDDYPSIMIGGESKVLVAKKDSVSGKCVFLASGVNMCVVHEYSPYICQMYPFQVPFDNYQQLELRSGIRCQSRFLCPAEKVDYLIKIARDFWTRDLPNYRDLVKLWNQGSPDGKFDAFVSFVLGV